MHTIYGITTRTLARFETLSRPFQAAIYSLPSPSVLVLCVIALSLLVPLNCSAQSRPMIDLTDPQLARMPVAIPDFRTNSPGPLNGRSLAQIIRDDLATTGLFHILDVTTPPDGTGPEEALRAWAAMGAQVALMCEYSAEGDELKLEARLYETALRRQAMGKKLSGTVSDHRSLVHLLANRVVERLTGSPGCFLTRIAFVGASNPKELFVMDYDGHRLQQVTRNGTINLSPEWAPDGRSILFTSYINRNPDLWSLDLMTMRPRAISTRPGINASARYSPDGQQIALSLSVKGIPKIFLITPQGHIINRLTHGRGNDISPTWSPDRSLIAYVSDQAGSPQIYIAPLDGGRPKRLTFQSNYNTDPDWSPKGDLLAFTARIDGRFQICTIRPDGQDFRVLTQEGSNRSPAWSPDGRMIAYSSTQGGGRKIFIMDARGDVRRSVSPIAGKSPAWSRRFR